MQVLNGLLPMNSPSNTTKYTFFSSEFFKVLIHLSVLNLGNLTEIRVQKIQLILNL